MGKNKVTLIVLTLMFTLVVINLVTGNPLISLFEKDSKEDVNTLPKEDANKLPGENYKEGYSKGDIALDFTLKDLNGKEHSLKEYRGKTVILNFWAST